MISRKIAIIPARSGSKGLKNKNILMLVDKPLIAYSIEAALKSGVFHKVIVSTDSLEYKFIAEKYGAEVILREEVLASDVATSFMVIEDVLNKYPGYDCFALLQPTSPFRNSKHIQKAFEEFEKNKCRKFLVSVVETNKASSLIKPIDEDLSLKHFDLDYSNYRRQNGKEYSPNGAIFIGNVKAYLEKKHFFGSQSTAFIMDKEDSIDIDDRVDFDLAISIQSRKVKEKNICESVLKRIKEKTLYFNKRREITLIGHSIFDFWEIDTLNGYAVNNLGISGITSEQCYKLILDNERITDVGNIVFLLTGTNDIVINGWDESYTIKWSEKIIQAIKKINPEVHIYMLAVPPVYGRVERDNRTIQKLNCVLQKRINRYNYVTWVPFSTSFYDPFGNLNQEFTSDGLHFTANAYKQLEQDLVRVLK